MFAEDEVTLEKESDASKKDGVEDEGDAIGEMKNMNREREEERIAKPGSAQDEQESYERVSICLCVKDVTCVGEIDNNIDATQQDGIGNRRRNACFASYTNAAVQREKAYDRGASIAQEFEDEAIEARFLRRSMVHGRGVRTAITSNCLLAKRMN